MWTEGTLIHWVCHELLPSQKLCECELKLHEMYVNLCLSGLLMDTWRTLQERTFAGKWDWSPVQYQTTTQMFNIIYLSWHGKHPHKLDWSVSYHSFCYSEFFHRHDFRHFQFPFAHDANWHFILICVVCYQTLRGRCMSYVNSITHRRLASIIIARYNMPIGAYSYDRHAHIYLQTYTERHKSMLLLVHIYIHA